MKGIVKGCVQAVKCETLSSVRRTGHRCHKSRGCSVDAGSRSTSVDASLFVSMTRPPKQYNCHSTDVLINFAQRLIARSCDRQPTCAAAAGCSVQNSYHARHPASPRGDALRGHSISPSAHHVYRQTACAEIIRIHQLEMRPRTKSAANLHQPQLPCVSVEPLSFSSRGTRSSPNG